MILLGVLSQYSWLDFITFILIVDGIFLAFGFALDKFVWSKDNTLTKNEQRNQREETDRRDYRKLSESASDYNEVVSVDENFDEDDSSDGMSLSEDYMPTTSEIAEKMDTYDDDDDAPSQKAIGDEDDDDFPAEMVTDDDAPSQEDGNTSEDLENENDQAQVAFFCDREDAEVITTGDDFDSLVNREYLEEDDQEKIYATSHHDEELSDVSIKQGEEGEFSEVNEGSGVISENELPEEFYEIASPKNLSDEMDDPEEAPEFGDD